MNIITTVCSLILNGGQSFLRMNRLRYITNNLNQIIDINRDTVHIDCNGHMNLTRFTSETHRRWWRCHHSKA